jgi:predicted nucleic acid-binding protein
VIYAVELISPYAALLGPLWSAAASGELTLVTSELTWLEALAKPLADGDQALERLFRAFLGSREMRLIPTDLAMWERAARLRALGLRTPDALHAATALTASCDLFVTNDPVFRRVDGLRVTVLSGLVGA